MKAILVCLVLGTGAVNLLVPSWVARWVLHRGLEGSKEHRAWTWEDLVQLCHQETG